MLVNGYPTPNPRPTPNQATNRLSSDSEVVARIALVSYMPKYLFDLSKKVDYS